MDDFDLLPIDDDSMSNFARFGEDPPASTGGGSNSDAFDLVGELGSSAITGLTNLFGKMYETDRGHGGGAGNAWGGGGQGNYAPPTQPAAPTTQAPQQPTVIVTGGGQPAAGPSTGLLVAGGLAVLGIGTAVAVALSRRGPGYRAELPGPGFPGGTFDRFAGSMSFGTTTDIFGTTLDMQDGYDGWTYER